MFDEASRFVEVEASVIACKVVSKACHGGLDPPSPKK